MEAVIEARLNAIFALEEGTIGSVLDAEECPIPDAELPAVAVFARAGTRSRSNADRRIVTRNFEIVLFVMKLCDGYSQAEYRDAYDAAKALLDLIPDILEPTRPNLRLIDADTGIYDKGLAGLTTVTPVGEPSDQGPEFREWAGEVYAAVTYTLPITYQRVRK